MDNCLRNDNVNKRGLIAGHRSNETNQNTLKEGSTDYDNHYSSGPREYCKWIGRFPSRFSQEYSRMSEHILAEKFVYYYYTLLSHGAGNLSIIYGDDSVVCYHDLSRVI